MRSTFSGLELSKRALQAQQTALNTTGHNIANANSAGYTRQLVNLQPTTPLTLSNMGRNLTVGTGSYVATIERARDIFVDRQFRWETSKQQYWLARETTLSKIEGILNEPTNNTLSNDLTNFWNAWSDLAKSPENLGARAVVVERAAILADTFHNLDQQLTEIQRSLDSNVRVQINQINIYAKQIQELNIQIKRAEVAGDNPNDLRDKRDALVDELSEIVNVRVVESRDTTFKDREVNIYKLYIGDDNTLDQILVDDTMYYQLKEPAAAGPDGLPFAEVIWGEGHPLAGKKVELGETLGRLKANLLLRGSNYDLQTGESKDNAYIAYIRNQFDELAKKIVEIVNAIHSQGINRDGDLTPPNFFIGDEAANIRVNPDIINDPWKIATGEKYFGDGAIAQKISALSSGWASVSSIYLKDENGNNLFMLRDPDTGEPVKDVSGEWFVSDPANGHLLIKTYDKDPNLIGYYNPEDGTFVPGSTSPGSNYIAVAFAPEFLPATSFGDFYNGAIAELGVDIQQATRMRGGQDVLVNQMYNQRQSDIGVSLDEEMTNLIRFQKAYAAAARVVTVLDDMLDKIVNGMGITR